MNYLISKVTVKQVMSKKVKSIDVGTPIEDRLAGLAPEELEQLVEKVPLEQRLAGLAPEDMPKLMKQIEAFLSQQQASDK